MSWGFSLQDYLCILSSRAVRYVILIRNECFGMVRFENVPKKQRPQMLLPSNVLQGISEPVYSSKILASCSPNQAQGTPWMNFTHTAASLWMHTFMCCHYGISHLNVELVVKFSLWVMNNTILFH